MASAPSKDGSPDTKLVTSAGEWKSTISRRTHM
uniref:Uncharacterized protein n=1 Tax=Anguilla anguilla TaxID=7936 RepID=A0A0E9XCQ0_ANGAN